MFLIHELKYLWFCCNYTVSVFEAEGDVGLHSHSARAKLHMGFDVPGMGSYQKQPETYC